MTTQTVAKPTVTVKRTGEVFVDGRKAGHVEKTETEGLFGSVRTEWIPYDITGEKLGNGHETRKRAVDRLAKSVEPLRVVKVERRNGWHGDFLDVQVSWAGTTMFASRYAHERVWVVDALFLPESMMPVFSNGSGARATRNYTLKDEWESAATSAATSAGLWPMA